MPRYTITEPHPTVAQNSYTHAGRGGAGNMFRAPATTPSAGVPTRPVQTQSNTQFYSGRGGAGNRHSAAERTAISFDEEFSRAEVREKASSMGHVGRGGAGNIFGGVEKKERKHSSSSTGSRRDSASTNGSMRSGFWGRLSNASLGH